MASTSHRGPLESPSTKDRKVAYKTPVTGQHQGQSHMTKWEEGKRLTPGRLRPGSVLLAPTPEYESSLAEEKRSRPHINPIKLNAF